MSPTTKTRPSPEIGIPSTTPAQFALRPDREGPATADPAGQAWIQEAAREGGSRSLREFLALLRPEWSDVLSRPLEDPSFVRRLFWSAGNKSGESTWGELVTVAAGEGWWVILLPPGCLPPAPDPDVLKALGLNPEESAPILQALVVTLRANAQLALDLEEARFHETRGAVIAALMHDFNNSMTGICSLSESLRAAFEDRSGGEPENLNLICESAFQAQGLLRRVVALNRERSAGKRLVDIGNCLDEYRPLLEVVLGRHTELSIRKPDAPIPVRLDPEALGTALLRFALERRDDEALRGRPFELVIAADDVLDEGFPQEGEEPNAARITLVGLSGDERGAAAAMARRAAESGEGLFRRDRTGDDPAAAPAVWLFPRADF